MPRTIEGNSNAAGLRVGIIAARFHDEFVDRLVAGAIECLARHGAADELISVYRVPGSFEIPVAARKLARTAQFDVLVALGVLIRGDTLHFELIASQVTNDLSRVALEELIPIGLGVITCNDEAQARARSGPKSGNKGWEAALAAIEMGTLFRAISGDNQDRT
ncbi:MAG TPA: 6,7-dimethyl-8-ribityllumazine synthase [Thermoanaerobaculia bacterium]|nr:6,7-dimethyl-8-ribityllumazine synthase [Thermoanaerobaculia bacterium]